MMHNLLFAIRNHLVRDYIQWRITGTSPRTAPIDIQGKLAELRASGPFVSSWPSSQGPCICPPEGVMYDCPRHAYMQDYVGQRPFHDHLRDPALPPWHALQLPIWPAVDA